MVFKDKQEFYDYIDANFTKPYSDFDLLNIGLALKGLPLKQRSWNELANRLGLSKSGDAYRCWCNNHKYDMEPKKADEVENREYEEQYAALTKNRDILNAYRRNIRDEARLDVLKNTIKEAARSLPELNNKFKNSNYSVEQGDVEAVALLSDLHIGVDCSNFYNTYNDDVAADRLNTWAEDIIKYCELYSVRRLNILNLGDLIHGVIHVSARLEQQYDVIQQIMTASELVANALYKIVESVPCQVIYRSVTDNHSRAVANLHEHIEKENLGRLIDWYLEERLKFTSISFACDNVDPSLGVFNLVNGKTFAFAHGHLENVNNIVQNFTGAFKQFIDYIAIGHYHSEKMKSFQGSKVYINGSIVGTEQYALGKRLFSEPAQTLLIFDGKNIVNISLQL